MKFHRIVKKFYTNPYGKPSNVVYIIQTKRRWCGLIPYWKTITHSDCGWGDCYQTSTKFKTIAEAESHIINILARDGKTDCHTKQIIKTYTVN